MGTSQSSRLEHQFQFHQLFPDSTGFKPLNNSQGIAINQHLHYTYREQSTGKIAEIRSFTVQGNKKQNIQTYFNSRARAIKSPYLFQLFNSKITQSKQSSSLSLGNPKNNQPSSNLCTMRGVRTGDSQYVEYSTLWLLVETSNFSLEDQIMNRVNKKPFQQIELWSVLSSSVLGAVTLLQNGFKQPVLSPKGIALSKDGTIKVGEWQLVSHITSKQSIQQGEVIFGKLGHCQTISQQNNNSLNQLLTKYYWAPQGLKYLEQFVSIGKKQINSSTARSARFASYPSSSANVSSTKFQIFSLGMTLITMCLRNCYYRSETFSEKYLSKLLHQAIQIRRVEGKELSKQLEFLIEAMIKWDPAERISYLELKDSIIRYLNKQSELKESPVSLKTYDNNENSHLNSVRTKNKNRTLSQGSNLSSIQLTQSGQSSFTDANYFTLNEQAGSSHNQTFSYNVKRKHLQSITSSCANEGSGMIQQGHGDDDWNLQSQKQQTVIQRSVQSQNSATSSPITHRTEKQLLTNNQNSPFDRINQDKPTKIICPASTPILTPSSKQSKNQQTSKELISQTGQKIEKMLKHKTNHVYLQSPDQSSQQKKQKKQKIPSLKLSNINNFSISKENFMLNNLSNRGSYRSLNKQPPNIKSARISSETDPEALLNASQNVKLKECSKDSQHQVRIYPQNQIILHFQDRQPSNLSQLQIDQEDVANKQVSYQYFMDEVDPTEQKENPDIFETFDQESMLHYSNVSRQVISQMASSATQRSYKIQPSDIKITISNLKPSLNSTQIPINYQNNRKILFRADEGNRNTRSKQENKMQEQFMTFNKKATNVQEHVNCIQLDNYVPSKWEKDKIGYQWLNETRKLYKSKIKVEQNDEKDEKEQQLFTDPKLMQYIRSPVQKFDKNMTSSIQRISQFNNNSYESSMFNSQKSKQSKQNKQNINDYVNKNKQTTSPITLLDMKASYEATSRFKNAQLKNIEEEKYYKMQFCDNYDSYASKIVKQRGARGFYEGEKKNGLRSGYGIFYYNQGGKYRGNWLNNKMHGRGTLQYADGRVAYQGQWSNDQLHGKGILYNQSPNFINHQMNYSNLDEMDECWIFYQGMFQHDDKCGMGLLVLSNQEQFVGQFKDDMAEGIGQYLRLDGSVVKGIWHKNKLVKIIEEDSNQIK